MLGGAGVLLGVAATPAQAAEVSYATDCVPPPVSGLPTVKGTTQVEITAPAAAKVGDEVEVVWKFTRAASKNPDLIDLPADSVQPSGILKAAGAQTASVAMQGPRENPAIPKGGAMILSDMKGKLKLTKAGEATLTPDAYAINVMSTDTKCAPTETVRPAATINVTAGEGDPPPESPGPTSPTPTPTGGTTGGTTGGGTGGGDTGGTSGGTTGGGEQTDFTGKAVDIPYACKTPIGDKNVTSPVQINAKKNGGNYDLTVQFKGSVMDSPADIPADSVKPSMEVVLGGADKGTVAVAGPTNAEAIKSGEPMVISDMTGTYKPGADGESTLSPGVLTVKALGTTTTCTPTKSAVSLTLDTAAQPGGAAGGSGSAGGSASGSGGSGSAGSGSAGGGLADTGSDDGGGLRALGFVAGTAVLLGGAVFTFMPRGRRG
ncbi:hypothetical protein ACIOKD_04160 [Streptomyces sp. NPDC087844]|uniref:hypothetical protein n=1 Tax=Streptomyces sp. NPDC087844 TaxID=3365805 RepID=UPI00381E0CC3